MAAEKSGSSNPRSLRRIVIGALGIAFICFVIIFMSAFYLNMTNLLIRVESEHMLELGAILSDVTTANLENMRSRTRTWSSWDDTFAYAESAGGAPLDKSIENGAALEALNMDYVIIKDLQGNDLFAGNRKGVQDSLPEGLSERIGIIAAEVLLHPTTKSYAVYEYSDIGFVSVGGKSYMVCVSPILTSDENSNPAGTFTFIKIFSGEQFKGFSQTYDTEITIAEQDPASPVGEPFVTTEDKDTISLTAYIENLSNERGAVLHFHMPRTFYSMSSRILFLGTIVVGMLVLGVVAVLYVILDRYLLRPMARLKTDLDKIAQNEMLDLDSYGQYLELSLLARTINDTISRLERFYRRARQSELSLSAVTSILNGLDAFIYVTDPDTDEILFMNDRMKAHYGIEFDPVGQVCWKLLQVDKNSRCDFCPCNELERSPDLIKVWEQRCDKTGRIHCNTDTIIEWVGGKKAHLQHIVDVTDEKNAQESLERQLSQQALMSGLSHNFLVADDFDSQIDRALKIVGEFMDAGRVLLCSFDPNERSFMGINEWLSPNPDWDMVSCLCAKSAIAERDSFIIDDFVNRRIQIINSDSMPRAVSKPYLDGHEFLVAPIYALGELWGTLDVCGNKSEKWTDSDVSLITLAAGIISVAVDRRLIEKQLHTMSSIVQYSPQFICYVDKDAELKYANPAVLPNTGYGEMELMAKGFHTLFDKETFEWVRDKLLPEILQNGSKAFEVETIRKSGEKRLWSVSGFAVADNSGYIGGIAHDITDIRRLERELISAKELAEQGSRAKSEFLSRMSHEMRTPMNAIIGMTNIAKASSDIAKKEYCLEKIENASMHLLGVINDVLDMSKIEADKFELSPVEFDFSHMLTNVINVIGFKIDEKSQKLSLTVDPNIPSSIIGDEQRLNQILINLLTNAVKFTPKDGSISLSFNLLEENADDLHIEIEVADNGIGISPEQQSKLFRSFEQADNSIARKFGGTGLGLVISRNIVQLMGGDIRVESEAGNGSKFIFDIRVKRGSEGVLESVRGKFSGKDLNILIVDDSGETRDYFVHVMESFDIPCLTACDGVEALESIKNSERPFDLIFVDWKMPKMNGIQLTKEIRRLKEADPVVVMISVAEWSDIEKEAIEAGVDGFVPKPLFPSLIMDCINKYVGRSYERKQGDKKSGHDPVENDGPKSLSNIFAGKVALLAEDVDVNREIVMTMLEETKIKIDCAENGLKAVQMFERDPTRYNIIIMDVHMPEMDGLEATRCIRAMDCSQARQVPIIAMTANVFREDIEKCIEAGMNSHVGKPISFDELLAKMSRYLS